MKFRSAIGSAALGMLLGLGEGSLLAQQATPSEPSARPKMTRLKSKPGVEVKRVSYQDPPAPPAVPDLPSTTTPTPTPPSVPDIPSTPSANPAESVPLSVPDPTLAAPEPGATQPPAAPSTAVPLSSNTDLSLPKSEREGGGGEPTTATAEAEAAAEPDDKDPTKLLMNALGLEESKTKVYGWIENSFTGNTNGTKNNPYNFGVNPNFLANRWMGHQYYLIVEKPLEQSDEINFGYRFDNLFGNDWQFNYMHGMLNGVFANNHLGWDPAQFYAEVHLPWLTKGGIDVKGGRFYTPLGYEVVPATGRPLLSVPYMFNYGQPFTHFGTLSTWHVTDRINWYNGVVNGWDRWINQNYVWNYLGGWTWASKDGKAALAMSYIVGPESFPTLLPGNQKIYPTGYVNNPATAGKRNPGYATNDRITFTTVFTYKWTETFTQVIESDQSIEKNVPGAGPGGTPHNAEWYSIGNWFLWQFYKPEGRGDVLTGVFRSEVFRDNNGVRTGFADNFYEMTLGVIYKPVPYIWVRPEARYDWAQFTHPYANGTKGSQFTLGFDVILLF